MPRAERHAAPSLCGRRLWAYNGRNACHPLLLSIKGRVLDVRKGAEFYGPGSSYNIMAGRDAR